MKRQYDSTVARIAGNIASGFIAQTDEDCDGIAALSVKYARAIVAEVIRTDRAAEPLADLPARRPDTVERGRS